MHGYINVTKMLISQKHNNIFNNVKYATTCLG
jgi:hypothetical protein